jgi:hypothetical protein
MIPVGTLATYQIGSDSYGYVVVDSTQSGKTIWLVRKNEYEEYKKLERNDGPAMGRDNEYAKTATLRKDGYYRWLGHNVGMISLGEAEDYLSKEF